MEDQQTNKGGHDFLKKITWCIVIIVSECRIAHGKNVTFGRLGNGHRNHLFVWMQFSTPWLKCQRHPEKITCPKTSRVNQCFPIFVVHPAAGPRGDFRTRSFCFSFFVGDFRWHDVVLPTMNRRSHTISIFSGLKSYAPATMASMGLLVLQMVFQISEILCRLPRLI